MGALRSRAAESAGLVWRVFVATALAWAVLPLVGPTPQAKADPFPGNAWVTDGDVDAMVIGNGRVYIGGRFTQVGPNTGGGAAVARATGLYDAASDRIDGNVFAAIPDGSGGWYIGGDFTFVDGLSRPRLAHLAANGAVTSWRPNVTNGAVLSLHRDGNTIFAGGSFTTVSGSTRNRLAAIDISSESAVLLAWNPGANGAVNAVAADGSGNLVIGGAFTSVAGAARNRLALINMTTGAPASWNPGASASVTSLAVDGSTLYVGGTFNTVGGLVRPSLASVDLATGVVGSWNPATNGSVAAVAVSSGIVYVGGSFTTAGGPARTNLAAINGGSGVAEAWNPAPDGPVNAVAVDGSDVFVAGDFLTIGGVARERAAAVTTAGVVTGFNPDANDTVHAIAVAGSGVYVGGEFGSVNGVARAGLAALDSVTGELDSAWAPTANGDVTALALSSNGSVVFVGGAFTTINGGDHRRIAAVNAVNGSIDPTFFAQANNKVHALHVADGFLYVGGDFGTVSSNARKRIAKLDEITGAVVAGWDPVVDDSVRAIATSPDGTLVYLGGLFDDIDGVARNEIAALNNASGTVSTTWNPNTNRRVYEFEVTADQVLVAMGGGGGRVYSFDPVSGATDWFLHVDGDVQTLATRGEHVYVGGHFLNVGAEPRAYFLAAELSDGSLEATWTPDGAGGLGPFVMEEDNGRIWAGGEFTEVAGRAAGRVAVIDAILFAPPGSYRDRILSDGASVYYRLGEGSGTTAIDEAGSNSATYSGGFTLGAPPLISSANTSADFNGSSGRLAIPDSSLINVGGPYEERTIELWFEADSTSGTQMIFEEGGATRGMNVYIEAGVLYLGAWNTSNNGDGTTPWPAPVFLSAPVSAGETYHVVLTLDHDVALTAYLNGLVVDSSDAVGRLFAHGNPVGAASVAGSTRLAGGVTTAPSYFDGTLDELAIYNTVLTEAQIAGHYLLGSLDTAAPESLIIEPTAGSAVSGTTTVGVVAEDDSDAPGTLSVEVSTDGGGTWAPAPFQASSGRYEYSWDTAGGPDGAATLLARATDSNANQATSPAVVVTVDNNNATPTAAITSPSPGASVSGLVSVEVDASDAEDPIGSLDVEVSVDGGPWAQAAWDGGSGRYTYMWDTGGLPEGNTDLQARAIDSEGAVGLSGVVTVSVVGAGEYASVVAADGADIHWRLGEVSGTVAADQISGVDGDYVGGPGLGVTGLLSSDPDTAVDFDGSNDVVDLPDDNLINFADSYEAKSVELWFNADDVSARGVLFEQGGTTRGISIYVEGGALHAGAWNVSNNGDGTTPWPSPVFLSAPVAAGATHHVVLTYDFAGNELRLYVDGLLSDSSGGVGRLFKHGSDPAIGAMRNASRFAAGGVGGNGFHFDGVIDEVSSYNLVLTPTQVAAHYQAGSAAGPEPLVDITSPEAGAAVSGAIQVEVTASDDADPQGTLQVEVRVDGGPWNPAAYNAGLSRYTWAWDSTTAPNGNVTLEARATDSEANVGSDSIVVVVANGSGYSAEVIEDNPAVYWRLDETSGSIAADVAGGLDGTYTGGVTLGAAGLVSDGTSAGFNGVDAYVDVVDSPLINLGDPIEARTIELWFSAANVGPRQVLFEEGGNSRGINMYVESGQLHYGAWNRTAHGDGTTPWPGGEIFISTPITAGTTYHVVLTLDQPGDAFTAYLNGAMVSTQGGIGRLYAHGSDIGIGAMINQARFITGGQNGDGFYFDGQLDEIAVYHTVLSAARVAAHYAAGT